VNGLSSQRRCSDNDGHCLVRPKASRFHALATVIDDLAVRALPPIGSVSQWIDSTDALQPQILQRLKPAYG
jgi:hypothetical protein